MYQLTLSSRKQLERASLRAQAEKPRIEEVGIGVYKVWSSDPARPWHWYTTGVERNADGTLTVCCTCPTQNHFCKHASAILPHYLMRERLVAEEVDWRARMQEMSDAEWSEVELRAESEAILDSVREMLERDRLDVFGY